MLQHLHISNYALIANVEIDFPMGFSVITGETGAGKSIILGALGLLRGERATPRIIKAGAQKCCVEASFDVSALGLGDVFEQNDLDFDGKECIVRREVTSAGKSRAFINDSPVSLSLLKDITGELIDIHSQHQNLLLTHEHFLLDILDTAAQDQEERDGYVHAFNNWRDATRQLQLLLEKKENGHADTDFLEFQLRELDAAKLHIGEQEELEAEAELLTHAEDVKRGLIEANAPFATDEGSLTQQIDNSIQALNGIEKVLPKVASLAERLESTRIELDDVSAELETLGEEIHFDPERQATVEERLDTIYVLEKKHKVNTIEALLQTRETIAAELNQVENIAEDILRQEKCVKQAEETLQTAAKRLSQARQQAAKKLQEALAGQLNGLGLANGRVAFSFTPRPRPDIHGTDRVTLLFSANKGVPAEDVAKIASGGEISRLMLALKSIMARFKGLPTIIFDEIDTGVSGSMAERMARVMGEMARSTQVICITHLPQIAAAGQSHYRVYKSDGSGATESHISRLSARERIVEIANMLSGEELTEAAVNNAKSLLKINGV